MALKAAIIDYSMGNLRSVWRAWQSAGADAFIAQNPTECKDADLLVFPGQGAITEAIKLLNSTGWASAMRDWVAADKPFFGICLGLQALFEYSEEGDCECLGIFKGSVKKLRLEKQYKVPHMGWNNVNFVKPSPILNGIDPKNDQFYFVHSYYVDTPQSEIVFGQTEYGGKTFTSAVLNSKLCACQFHPEKSQSKGLLLYSNFLKFANDNK